MPTRRPPVPVRVLLVEPQPLLAECLAFFLAAHPQLLIVGQIASDLTSLHFIKASPPDVLLVDVDGPSGLNFDLLIALHQSFPGVPLVVLTACTQPSLLRRLLALPLAACLTKAQRGQEIIAALLTVTAARGATIVATALTPLLAADPASADFAHHHPALTTREQEIFSLLRTGKTNQQIAQLLHINAQTVRNHAQKIYAKLGVRSRTDLILLTNQPPR